MHFVIDICSENTIGKGVYAWPTSPRQISSYCKSNKCPSESQPQGALLGWRLPAELS